MARRLPVLLGGLLVPVTVAACAGDDPGPTGPTDPGSRVTTITVRPDSVELTEEGGTQTFDATARDQDGNPISGVTFAWSVEPDSVATIDTTGTATAEAAGTATVEATARGRTGTAKLTVDLSLDSLSCDDLAFEAPSAVPLDSVGVSGLPEALEPPVFAEVATDRDTGQVFVGRAGGTDGFMRVPVVPGGDPDGGEVALRVTDGKRICPPRNFTVKKLPAAPGTFASAVDSLEEILELHGELMGVDTEALPEADPDTLPRFVWPLALARNYIDGPDNPNSLRKILDGSAPLLEGETGNVELTDRLLARSGVPAALSAELDRLREGSAGGGQTALTGAAAEITRVECDPTTIDKPQTLDACMSIQASANFKQEGVTAKVRRDLGITFGVVGLIPGAGIPAAMAGAALFLHGKVLEGTANLLPSEFTEGDFTLTKRTYLEDEPGPDRWEDAWVKAASNGWTLDQAVLEALLQFAGGASAYDDYINGFMRKSDVAETVKEFIVTELTSRFIDATEGSDIIRLPPDTTLEVPIHEEEWSRQRLLKGEAVAFVGHRTYEPRQAGTAVISVGTDPDHFADEHWADSASVEVKELQVIVRPDERIAEPGEVEEFEVEVVDAHDPAIEATASAGQASVAAANDALHTVEVTTPADREAFPVAVTVTETSETGARAHSDEVRSDGAVIWKIGSIVVEPGGACVEHGRTQVFDATIRGVANQEVSWSASAGSIGPGGTFTAPDQDTRATVTATSAADPDISDTATVIVRNVCDEWWTVSAGLQHASGDQLSILEEGGFFQVQLGPPVFPPPDEFFQFHGVGGRLVFAGRFDTGWTVACSEDPADEFLPCFYEILKDTASRTEVRIFGAALLGDVARETVVTVPISVWFSGKPEF